MVHDHQPVHGGDGGEAVGNGDHRLAGHQVIELLLDRLLHLRVQGAGGLVEDKDRRVLQQHAGDGDALALATGKLYAAFTNMCRVALAALQVLKPSDELVGLRFFGGGDGRCIARPRPAVEDVVTDGAVQQGGVLCHHTDLRPEAVLGDVRDILAIDQDAAGFEVVEAQQQVDQCRFACAGAANQSHLLTGPDPQGEVMDHAAASTRADLCGATVVKAHVLKADFTGAHYERPAVEPVNDKIWATDGLNALLHDANVFEDAGDYPQDPPGHADDAQHEAGHGGDGTDRDEPLAPQPYRQAGRRHHQTAIERIEHELHRCLQAQRRLVLRHLILERVAGIGILPIGVGEQLDGENIGVTVDDAPNQHGPRLGSFRGTLFDARHKVKEGAAVGHEPHDQRKQEAPIGGGKHHRRADPLYCRVPDGIDQLHDGIAQRRCRLHEFVGHTTSKVVLKETEALAQDVAMCLPTHAVGDGGADQLVLDEVVAGRHDGSRDHGDERHPQQDRPMP